MTEQTAHRILVWLFRLFGGSMLFALIFVAAPHGWMRDIHASLELGPMPDTPVFWYLARSTSFFYALVGGLFVLVSFDLSRYRPVVVFLAWGTLALGVTLLVVDLAEGMPPSWTASEGPTVIVSAAVMLWLVRRVPERAA